jgi:hypothetical protein
MFRFVHSPFFFLTTHPKHNRCGIDNDRSHYGSSPAPTGAKSTVPIMPPYNRSHSDMYSRARARTPVNFDMPYQRELAETLLACFGRTAQSPATGATMTAMFTGPALRLDGTAATTGRAPAIERATPENAAASDDAGTWSEAVGITVCRTITMRDEALTWLNDIPSDPVSKKALDAVDRLIVQLSQLASLIEHAERTLHLTDKAVAQIIDDVCVQEDQFHSLHKQIAPFLSSHLRPNAAASSAWLHEPPDAQQPHPKRRRLWGKNAWETRPGPTDESRIEHRVPNELLTPTTLTPTSEGPSSLGGSNDAVCGSEPDHDTAGWSGFDEEGEEITDDQFLDDQFLEGQIAEENENNEDNEDTTRNYSQFPCRRCLVPANDATSDDSQAETFEYEEGEEEERSDEYQGTGCDEEATEGDEDLGTVGFNEAYAGRSRSFPPPYSRADSLY